MISTLTVVNTSAAEPDYSLVGGVVSKHLVCGIEALLDVTEYHTLESRSVGEGHYVFGQSPSSICHRRYNSLQCSKKSDEIILVRGCKVDTIRPSSRVESTAFEDVLDVVALQSVSQYALPSCVSYPTASSCLA